MNYLELMRLYHTHTFEKHFLVICATSHFHEYNVETLN